MAEQKGLAELCCPPSHKQVRCMPLSWWAAHSCCWNIFYVAAGGWTSCLWWAQDWPQSEAAVDSPHLKMSPDEIGRRNGILSLAALCSKALRRFLATHPPLCIQLR